MLISSSGIAFAQTAETQLDDWPEFEKLPYASKKVSGHDFKVVLKDMPDTRVILGYHYANKQYTKDTAQTDKNGVAHFIGDEDWEGGVYLIAVNGRSLFEFVYSCTEKGFSFTTDSKALIEDIKIKGSPENEWFIDYQKERIKTGRKQSQLLKRYDKHKESELKDSLKVIEELFKDMSKNTKEYQLNLVQEHPGSMLALIINLMREIEIPDPPAELNNEPVDTAFWQFLYYKKHYWDFVDFSDDRIIRTPIFRNKVGKFIGEKVTLQIPDSICENSHTLLDKVRKGNKMVYRNILTQIMSKYETSNIMGMNGVVCCIGQKYYMNDPAIDWIKPKRREKVVEMVANECNVVIGKQARDLIMLDTLRIPRSLHAVQAEYTIAYFYSSTCGHCQKTTPKIKEIYDEYKEKGVKVYAVNTEYKDVKNDAGELVNRIETEKYHNYIRKNDFDWINVADPLHRTKFRDYFNINATPVTYLLDKNKMFVGVKLDPITLRKLLLHEIDGLNAEEIETYMKENGYVVEKTEEEKEDSESDSAQESPTKE